MDDLNEYEYVHDDPLNNTDPTGLIAGVDDAAEAVIVVGAVVVAAGCYYACPGVHDAIVKAGTDIYNKVYRQAGTWIAARQGFHA